jgi:excisionase family DNA binding protein
MRFMTIREFAALMNVHESTVRRLIAKGLPHIRLTPRNPRIKVQEAIAWFEKNETNAADVLH